MGHMNADAMLMGNLCEAAIRRHRMRQPSARGSPSEEALAGAVDGRC